MVSVSSNYDWQAFWRNQLRANIKHFKENDHKVVYWVLTLMEIRPELTSVLLSLIQEEFPQYESTLKKLMLLQ